MVTIEKSKVILRSRSSGRSSDKEREVETQLRDYGDSRIAGTNIVVSVAVATYTLKSEDRFQVLRLSDDEAFRKFFEMPLFFKWSLPLIDVCVTSGFLFFVSVCVYLFLRSLSEKN